MSVPDQDADVGVDHIPGSQQPAPVRCMRCHTALAPNGAYKHTCDACRKIVGAKVNAKLKKDVERVRAKMRALAAPHTPAQVETTKPIVPKVKATIVTPQPRKRKVEEVSGTETEQENTRPFKVTAHKGKEYQMEDALLEALAAQWDTASAPGDVFSSTAPGRVTFIGAYTVVLDPSVASETRVEQLVAACKNDKRIPIGKQVRRYNGASERHSQEYWCTCEGIAAPPKPPNPPPAANPISPQTASPSPDLTPKSGAPLKHSQSTLTSWLAATMGSKANSSGGKEDAPGCGVCGGTIGVDAVTDFSHPLARKGIKGQRVMVQVRHRDGTP